MSSRLASLTFVTPNGWKHEEASRLLASIDVHWSRLGLSAAQGSLEEVARARALEAFVRLGAPAFVENTALRIATDDYGFRDGLRGGEAKRVLEALGEAGFCARFGGLAAETRIVVAVAKSARADEVVVFEGSLEGAISARPRGEAGYGWDRVFQPEGYARTLSELEGAKFLVNMREKAYLDLADHVLARTFGGSFEAHVTVAPEGEERIALFARVCDSLGVKCVQIELPRGEVPFQPMTASYHRGHLRDVQNEVNDIARAFVREGFVVTRTKIEAHGKNADVPETKEEAARLPPRNYFEFHVKVLVPLGASFADVAVVAARHDAHLSRSASTSRIDGTDARFVTMRVHHEGRAVAEARFGALLADLAALGYALRNRLREYTFYDSNIAVDKGWI